MPCIFRTRLFVRTVIGCMIMPLPLPLPLPLMLPLMLMLMLMLSRLSAADTEQSIPVYCQNVQPGSHYAAQLTADSGQEVASNEYILTFDQAGASISTTAGTVIAATTATPEVSVLYPCETIYDFPADAGVEAMDASGISMPEIVIEGGSSDGVGPYGVTDCSLAWYGDGLESGVSDTFFWTANQPAIEAATPVLSGLTTTPNGTAVTGTVGVAFNYQISATNTPIAYSFISISPPSFSLPAGLSFNTATGLISGTPTAAGSAVLNLVASNTVWSGSEELTINIAPAAAAPQISSALSATATVGTAFSYQITASNTATGFTASGIPPGLSCNATSGLVSGTPTTPGPYEAQINASNGSGSTASTLDIVVSPAAGAPVITNLISYAATVGTPVSLQLTATNTPTSFALGAIYNDPALGLLELPPGLSFTAGTGLISGTPTASGVFALAVYASNGAGLGAIFNFRISIAPADEPVISSASSENATVGTPFSYQITASGTPTSFQASALAPGLSITASTGAIGGTPTTAGSFVVVLKATNAGGTGVSFLTISINLNNAVTPPVITSALTATAQAGSVFTYSVTASNTPTSFSASFLPVGLSINAVTGVISGTPPLGGACSVTITATNAGGSSSAVLTINIAGGATGAGGSSAATTSGGGGGVSSGGSGGGGGCGLGAGTALLVAGLLALGLQRLRSAPLIRPQADAAPR